MRTFPTLLCSIMIVCFGGTAHDTSSNKEPCIVYTSVEELRSAIFDNQHSFIQGLNAREARLLYHQLLPKCIVDSPKYSHLSVCAKAELAYLARKANKEYIRERSNILVSAFAKIMDFWRTGRVNGITAITLWNKKAKKINANECIISGNEESKLWNQEKCQNVCHEMLKSSTRTNKFVDGLAGIKQETDEKSEPSNIEKEL